MHHSMVISVVVVVVVLLPPSVTISIEIYFRDFLLLSCRRRRIHVVNSNRIRPENAQRTANSSKQAANCSLVCGVTVSCVAFGKRANERENEWQLRCS